MKLSGSMLDLNPKTRNNMIEFENSGIDYVHIDVMDGVFVPNKENSINEVETIVGEFNYDVHLMVKDVKKYIDDFLKIKPLYITFHIETGNIFEMINYLKLNNVKVGISIKPNTDIKDLYPYLKYIDLVLIMSVEPGLGGQKFMPDTVDRINILHEYRKKNNLNYQISVDGGINNETIKYLKKCDIAVIGSYISKGNYKERVDIIRGEI